MADKQLLLLRHGKASWQHPVSDFDRPLTATGEKQARCIADWLKNEQIIPDCWLVSAATRTMQTAEIVRLRLDQQGTRQNISRSLYLAEPAHLLTTLQAVPDSASCVVLVGHNPGISELLINLAGSQLGQFSLAPDIMWPATLACLTFSGNWTALDQTPIAIRQLQHGKLLPKAYPD